MPTILHTEASLGLGGQELRILAETRWLRDHGWGALVACQPGSGLLAEARSEEHTSELQSQSNIVCRLLLEKKKQRYRRSRVTYLYSDFSTSITPRVGTLISVL